MEQSREQQEQTATPLAELTLHDQELLDAVRRFDWCVSTDDLAASIGQPAEILEQELVGLADKQCLQPIRRREGETGLWILKITNPAELERLKTVNNPDGEDSGHFTGRCMSCESTELWSDYTAYGCKCCGADFDTSDIPPRKIENGTGRDLGPAVETADDYVTYGPVEPEILDLLSDEFQ